MEVFLRNWNLDDEYIQNFIDQGIDEESFKLLDEATIACLIPKAGPRLKFKNKLKDFLCALEQQNLEPIVVDTITSEIQHGYSFSPGSDIENILNECSSDFSSTTCATSVNSFIAIKKRKSPDASPELPERTDDHSKRKRGLLFPEGLENFLKSSVDGRFVLSFRENLGYRSNLPRKKLCKEIVNRFLQLEHVDNVSKEVWMFEEASIAIIQLFPHERKEIYFIPYKKKSTTSPKKGPKGRLWSRYHNVRNLLKVADNPSVRKTLSNSICSTSTDIEEENEERSDVATYKLLNTVLEPITKVLELWESTYLFRKKHFKSFSIEEIFSEVPALKTNIGPELVNSDFNEKYPDVIDNIYLKWPKLSNAIIKEAEQRKVNVIEDSNDIDPSILALLTLPYLIPPVTLKRTKDFNWRPSRSEIQESFFFHVQNIDDVEKIVTRRKQKLAWANSTLQPFGVIVGPLNMVTEYRLFVGEISYKFDSLLRSLEILFKSFHSLNIKYPIECQHVWCFLECMLYDMKCKSSSAASLMADIKPHLLKD